MRRRRARPAAARSRDFRERRGDYRVAMLKREHVVKMLAEIEGASARRSWFKAIRPLLQHAVPTVLRDDPTLGIPTPKRPKSKGHHRGPTPRSRAIARIGRAGRNRGSCSSSRWRLCHGAAKSCASDRSMSDAGLDGQPVDCASPASTARTMSKFRSRWTSWRRSTRCRVRI